MRIVLAAITARKRRLKSSPADELLQDYVQRASRYTPVDVLAFTSESELWEKLERERARTRPHLILLDSRGEALTSEGIAARLAELRGSATQQVWLALGPHDGWSPKARAQADLLLSLGAITLPHELCLVVAAEQLYRAFAILAGHPYHGGH